MEPKEDNNLDKNNHPEKVDSETVLSILENCQINGAKYLGQQLTPDILVADGLSPQFEAKLDDSVTCYLSKIYEIVGSKKAVTAYILDPRSNKYEVCPYYLSDTQAVWRFMPDYGIDQNGNANLFGKGYGEESTTLPIALQSSLASISESAENILSSDLPDGSSKDYSLDFFGAAPVQGSDLANSSQYYNGSIDDRPIRLEGYIGHDQYEKTEPQEIVLENNQEPDFNNLISSWNQATSRYGEVKLQAFPSTDGKLKYVFCKSLDNKAWIAHIENDSDITPLGIKRSWVKHEDLTTPLLERGPKDKLDIFSDPTGGYGVKIANSLYLDMFSHYLSKVPIIHRFLEL